MSTDAPPLEATLDPNDRVSVRLDELIVGRPLQFPIHDENGVLLLAEGKVISADFKRLLRGHGVKSVKVHRSDANLAKVDVSLAIPTSELNLDCEFAKQLDKVIDCGLLGVNNKGPAVAESRKEHGREGYNAAKSEAMAKAHDKNTNQLSEVMKRACHGGPVNGAMVTQLAASYLADIADDTDCVMNVAMKATSDKALSDHCLKMAVLGMAIGVEMGLDEENCRRVCVSGLVHDWGMARVPNHIRQAERPLTTEEFFEVRKHPVYTAEILDRSSGMPTMAPIIAYQVHERPNGLGYPRGRGGDRIHLLSRILAVADTFAALTSARPHRPSFMPYAAMECVIKLAKSRDLDPEVVRAFLKVMSLFPIGSFVVLSDGSVGQVLRRNGEHYAYPIVQLLQDPSGEPIPRDTDETVIDLSTSELSVIQALPTPGKEEIALTDEWVCPQRSTEKAS